MGRWIGKGGLGVGSVIGIGMASTQISSVDGCGTDVVDE